MPKGPQPVKKETTKEKIETEKPELVKPGKEKAAEEPRPIEIFETKLEKESEAGAEAEKEDVSSKPAEPDQPVVVATPKPTDEPATDRLTEEIEDIMEEDLTDLFLSMDPKQQQEFKEKGEETLGKIRELVGKAKVNARKVFSLLKDWLKIIPGVNRFFLLQEAKLKTDKILLVSEEEKRRGSGKIEEA